MFLIFGLKLPLSSLRQVLVYINNVEFNCWVVVRDIIRSLYAFHILYLLIRLIFAKLRRLRLVCSPSVPDPTKNETGQLSYHWNDCCNNIDNAVNDLIEDLVYMMSIINHSVVIKKQNHQSCLNDH